MCRHENDLTVRLRLSNRTQHIKTTDIGHTQVDERDVSGLDSKARQRLTRTAMELHVIAGGLHGAFNETERPRLVVNNDEQRSTLAHGWGHDDC
jgi:hypothetical protein